MNGSVLLIEDDAEIRRVLSSLLKRSGLEVVGIGTGRDGLALFHELQPDVCLLDLNLPDISGFEILPEMVRAGATVVILTGQGDVETAVQAIQMGAENFLTKPVDTSHLLASVTRAMESSYKTSRLFA